MRMMAEPKRSVDGADVNRKCFWKGVTSIFIPVAAAGKFDPGEAPQYSIDALGRDRYRLRSDRSRVIRSGRRFTAAGRRKQASP